MKKNILKLILTAFVGVIFLAGCSNKSQTNTDKTEKSKKEIIVATSGAPKPFSYVADNGKVTGYDIEVVEAIFKNLPEYTVKFEKTEFTSVLAGLDTDRYQIAANNFAMNDDRKEKYIYSDPIFKNQYVIAVSDKNEDIKTFNDLKNKSTEVSPGLNYATALENYNAENPDAKVKIDYSEAELLNVLQNVESRKYDFQLIDKAMGQLLINEHNLKLKLIDLSEKDAKKIASPYSYLLLSKTDDGEQLVKEINKSLKTIIDDGTVSKISEKFLGGDFAPK